MTIRLPTDGTSKGWGFSLSRLVTRLCRWRALSRLCCAVRRRNPWTLRPSEPNRRRTSPPEAATRGVPAPDAVGIAHHEGRHL